MKESLDVSPKITAPLFVEGYDGNPGPYERDRFTIDVFAEGESGGVTLVPVLELKVTKGSDGNPVIAGYEMLMRCLDGSSCYRHVSKAEAEGNMGVFVKKTIEIALRAAAELQEKGYQTPVAVNIPLQELTEEVVIYLDNVVGEDSDVTGMLELEMSEIDPEAPEMTAEKEMARKELRSMISSLGGATMDYLKGIAEGNDELLELMQVEVTEREPLSPKHIEALQNLKDLGYRIALDDFDTQHFNLNTFVQFPELWDIITTVKIDRNPQTTDPKAFAEMIETLKTRGMKIVYEGVETREKFDALDVGVDAQGYLFGRPPALSEYLDELKIISPQEE